VSNVPSFSCDSRLDSLTIPAENLIAVSSLISVEYLTKTPPTNNVKILTRVKAMLATSTWKSISLSQISTVIWEVLRETGMIYLKKWMAC
jgi:hypothetical protein